MGKKGKKKGNKGPQGSDAGPSQAAPQPSEAQQVETQQQKHQQEIQRREQQRQQQKEKQQQQPQQQQPQQQQQWPQRQQQQQQQPQRQQQQQQQPQQQKQQPQQQQQWPQQQQQQPQRQQQQQPQRQQQQQQQPQQQQQWPQQQQQQPQRQQPQQQQQWPQRQQQQQQQPQRQQQQQPQQQVQQITAAMAESSLGSGPPPGGNRHQEQQGRGRPSGRGAGRGTDAPSGMPQRAPGAPWGPRPSHPPTAADPAPQVIPAAHAPSQVPGASAWGQGGRGGGRQQSREFTPPAGSRSSPGAGDAAPVTHIKKTSMLPESAPVNPSLSAEQQAKLRSQIPRRKNPKKGGTSGEKITVETNMIPFQFSAKFPTTVTHYDVKFDPEKPRFMIRPVIEAIRAKHYSKNYPAFDGRANLYAAGDLPFGNNLTTDIEVENPERGSKMTFKVMISKCQDIDMSWLRKVEPGLAENERQLTSVQALDIILRAAPIRQGAITVGRSFFTNPPGIAVDLGNGVDLWVGTFQSTVLGWKPYFNIDVAHKGFPRGQRVIEAMEQVCGLRSGEPPDNRSASKLTSFLKNLKVRYKLPNDPASKRTMTVIELGPPARSAEFRTSDGSMMTVEQYYRQEKKYNIRSPLHPTLRVGSRQKYILLPAELCEIEAGQVTNKKLNDFQTSKMIKSAATDTHTRKRKIMEGFSKMRFNQDPAMKEFGITVGSEFERVDARVLQPPLLMDTGNIRVKSGVWRPNGFHSPTLLEQGSWTIINVSGFNLREDVLRNFWQNLQSAARQRGMKIGDPITPFEQWQIPSDQSRFALQKFMEKLKGWFDDKKRNKFKLIIVIVPDRVGPFYGKVKQASELHIGLLTQCVKRITVERKMSEATAGNIILKVNSKLNGTNHVMDVEKSSVQCLKAPCMVVGADVTHPSPDSVGIPSIAAVAASHTPSAFKYNVQIRLQPPKTEIIIHLEEMMIEHLKFFYRASGRKPAKIIFYRDGVSEGQFPQVMHHEFEAIRRACRKVSSDDPNYKPAITFLVVQKRHHIRLFPTDKKDSVDRNFNVKAGTVVDTDITHPSHIDFYLVSHASIQGTARPTKYRCLWDDSDMSEDEIEQLTYYLCHMFSRCSRSVSYPAPTYYAHLAAFRARALTNDVNISLDNLAHEQKTKMTIRQEIQQANPMFFV